MGANQSQGAEGEDGTPASPVSWLAAQADPKAAWRSDTSKELDKLGGAQRRAVLGRGSREVCTAMHEQTASMPPSTMRTQAPVARR